VLAKILKPLELYWPDDSDDLSSGVGVLSRQAKAVACDQHYGHPK
jgi:hypothetical protein